MVTMNIPENARVVRWERYRQASRDYIRGCDTIAAFHMFRLRPDPLDVELDLARAYVRGAGPSTEAQVFHGHETLRANRTT